MNCKSILVIDRDHECRVLIRRKLEDEGYFVVSATSGSEALMLLEKISRPDLILLRKDLFGMSAEQFLIYLRQRKDLMEVPISLISNNSAEVLNEACCNVSPNDLTNVLRTLNPSESKNLN